MSQSTEPTTLTYSVPGMSCGHCKSAVTDALTGLAGVQQVEVDLDAKLVRVAGQGLDDAALTAAIDEAGYDATRA